MMRTISLLAPFLLLAPGAFAADADAERPSHDAHTAFEAIKSLEGTWVGTVAEDGDPAAARETTIVYDVTSNGHSVIETFAPGSDYEMFSVYHLDGDELRMTHYCAIGNAPRMRFTATQDPGVIEFEFDGGSNLDPAVDIHAHEGSMQILDADHIEKVSIGYADGQPAGRRLFKLQRQP